MPSISKRADELENKFMKGAPERNKAKIKRVLDVYKQRSGGALPDSAERGRGPLLPQPHQHHKGQIQGG